MPSILRDKIRHASRNSDLASWLAKNHEWFAKELDEAGRPNWDAITQMLNEKEGLTDKNGNPYKKASVRMAVRRFLNNVPPPKIHNPPPPIMPTLPMSSPVNNPAPLNNSTDFIALQRAIKEKRTIK